jgi:hypothetical protein
MDKDKEPGYIWAPYILINVSTSINGETVWYRNKFKNFFLKVKHFFFKPKYLKNFKNSQYLSKQINPKFYSTIELKNQD